MKNETITGQLGDTFCIGGEAVEGHGEDSYLNLISGDRLLLAVFDGSGGLGSREYEAFDNHTGAYIASRAVCGALHDWFLRCDRFPGDEPSVQKISLAIMEAYGSCTRSLKERFSLKGSMVRDFPTTLAAAVLESEPGQFRANVLWAGDSRVYLWDRHSLCQLTEDDAGAQDALKNLYEDAQLTNVLSSDGKFMLHSKLLRLNRPSVLFAATDGCFGYVPSPMDFEYLFLGCICDADSPAKMRSLLNERIRELAGDDYSLSAGILFYDSYKALRADAEARRKELYEDQIRKLDARRDDFQLMEQCWSGYREGYERYLQKA